MASCNSQRTRRPFSACTITEGGWDHRRARSLPAACGRASRTIYTRTVVGGACDERGQTRRRVGGSAHMRSMLLSEVSASNFTCASSSSWITIHAAEVNSGTLTSITGCRQATHFSDGRGLHLHTSDSGQRGMPREYMPAFVPYGLGCMRLALVASPIRRRPTRSNDDGLTTRSESKSSRCVNGRTKLGVSTRAQKSVLNPGTNELAICGCWATTERAMCVRSTSVTSSNKLSSARAQGSVDPRASDVEPRR